MEQQIIATVKRMAAAGRSTLRVLAALTTAIALGAGPSVARADAPPELAKFAGEFKYGGTHDQGVAIVNKAIDEGMADVNMVMRFMIKKGLADHFVDVIIIKTPSGKIGIKTGELPEALTEIGKAETFTGKDGKSLKVTHQFDGAKITEVSVGEFGTSTTVYELAADGKTLHRNVTFKGDRMEKAVKYRLDYKRK